MAVCVVVGLAALFILPRIGVPLVGASLIFPLLMIGCCVVPMLFMMKMGSDGKGMSCCSKESKSEQKTEVGSGKINSR